jgi:hypothetical protein
MTESTPLFPTQRSPARNEFISLRVDGDQKQLMIDIADILKLDTSELLRVAVQYYLDNDARARRACRQAMHARK